MSDFLTAVICSAPATGLAEIAKANALRLI